MVLSDKIVDQFQSTLPRGERRQPSISRGICLAYFNPRSHEGSDICHAVSVYIDIVFQSTLPRGERQWDQPCIKIICVISIHAPTRGATRLLGTSTSQHFHFNPRSHEGSDPDRLFLAFKPIRISIHAPTRGATAIFAKKFSFLSAKIV